MQSLRGVASTAADMMPTRLRTDHWGGPDLTLAEDDPAWRPECVKPSVLQTYAARNRKRLRRGCQEYGEEGRGYFVHR